MQVFEGLQLCNGSTSLTGAPRCSIATKCKGATPTYCDPFDLWTGTLKSGATYHIGQLSDKGFLLSAFTAAQAFSVRRFKWIWKAMAPMQTNTGAPRCYQLNGKCKGAAPGTAYADQCYSVHIWSDKYTSGKYHTFMLYNGSFCELVNSPYVSTFAASVRCVKWI